MKLPDISYKVLYHFKGYIRIELSAIKTHSWTYLLKNINKSLASHTPGIKNFYFNPITGNMVITYKPDDINVLEFIKEWLRSGLPNRSSKDEYYEMPSSY
jgi:hypothetical protein